MGAESNICTKLCNFKSTAALIVDSNIVSNELMERTLSGLKIKHIHCSFSVEDALSLLSDNVIGIVIVNADTIHEKALQLLEMVRFRQAVDPILEGKMRNRAIVPFVITSSSVTPEMVEKVSHAGICALVSIPLKPFDLMRKIKRLLYVHCEENCFKVTMPLPEGGGFMEEPGTLPLA